MFLILFCIFHMTLGSNFLLNRAIIFEMHKLSPGLLPRLHQVCGKMFYFTTGGIAVENVILHKIILFYSILFILFYSTLNFVMLSLEDVRSDYICKVLDVMTFYILFYLFHILFCYVVTQDVRSDYICKVLDVMTFYIGRWNSQFILYCLYIVTDVESQGCMLLPFNRYYYGS